MRISGRRAAIRQWGAVASARLLALVCLEFDSERVTLSEEHILEMAGEDQESLLAFAADVLKVFQSAGADSLLVRHLASYGPRRASHLAHKIEAVLALLPDIYVEAVSTMRVWGFDQRVAPELPEPDPRHPKRRKDLLHRAYQTAAYGLDAQVARLNGQRSDDLAEGCDGKARAGSRAVIAEMGSDR